MSRGALVHMGLPRRFAAGERTFTPGEIRWVLCNDGQYSYGVSFLEDMQWMFSLGRTSLAEFTPPPAELSIAEAVLNSMSDAIFSVTRELRINSFNRAAEELTGRKRDEVLGKKCSDVFRVDCCEECILAESIRQGVPVINHAVCLNGSRGQRISATIDSTPLYAPDGRIAGGVQVFHNVSTMPGAAVSIRTLGRFSLTMNDQMIYDRFWRGRRPKELLKAIIALGGTKVPLEKLAYLLWPDSDGDHALNNLKMAISRLRHVGGDDFQVPDNWLAVKHKRVSLVRSICRVDALEFAADMERVAESRFAAGLSRALGQYAGDFLPDDDEPWIRGFRRYLRRLFIDGVCLLASQENAEPDRLLAFLEQARRIDPLNEDVHACLMRHYLQAGCPAHALRIFHQVEKNITRRTGLPPGATLQSLARQAKNSRSAH
jgi:PAS domain S-box-containing protein